MTTPQSPKPHREPLDVHRVAAERGIKLMTSDEFFEMVEKICEGMTLEEREALADEIDPKWRDNGRA